MQCLLMQRLEIDYQIEYRSIYTDIATYYVSTDIYVLVNRFIYLRDI